MTTTTSAYPPVRPFPPWPTFGAAVLVVIASFFTGIVAGIPAVVLFGRAKNPGDAATNVIEAGFYLGGAAALVPLLERVSHRPLDALGIRPPDRRAWGFVVGGIVAVALAQMLYQLLLTSIHQQNHVQAGFENFRVTSREAAAMVLVNGALIAPIVEELFFRGLIFNALAVRLPFFWAALISGLIFGLGHGDLVLFPVLTVFGMIQAMIYRATGNLVAPMIVHAVNNGVFLSLMIAVPGFH